MQGRSHSKPHPIGVFDSGLGGLSILRQLQARLPGESFVYLADQGRAPYGDLPEATVRSYTKEAVDHLLAVHGVTAVVVACNTASDAALEHLRDRWPATPFIGMEPAVKPAARASEAKKVGVLATTRTIEGRRLARVIEQHANDATIYRCPCPGLVELVEDGLADTTYADTLIAAYVTPLIAEGVDTLVLGCTHYSFLTNAVQRVAGPNVAIIDPSHAVAAQTVRVLTERGALEHHREGGSVRFETSGDRVRMRAQLREILDLDVPTHGIDHAADDPS